MRSWNLTGLARHAKARSEAGWSPRKRASGAPTGGRILVSQQDVPTNLDAPWSNFQWLIFKARRFESIFRGFGFARADARRKAILALREEAGGRRDSASEVSETPAAAAMPRVEEEVSNICMLCGKPALDAWEDEEDIYGEYGVPGEFWMIWVYCKPCDCWTHHKGERITH